MRALILHPRRVAFAAALGFASSLGAQLPNSSAAAAGMGGNFTAIARGYEAVAWNPANLAMPGRPFMSFGTAIAGGNAGLAPIDLKMLHEFSGQVVDSATRVSWVDQARLAGGQEGRVDAGLTFLGLSVGPLGFQVGSSLYTNMKLSPDAFEAFLFGNAGRSGGQPKVLDFTGTSVRSAAFTTGAMSFAMSIPTLTGGLVRNEHAAIAITGKYIVGNGLVLAQDNGSSLGASDIQLRFPVITVHTEDFFGSTVPTPEYDGQVGRGIGADVSFAWSGGPFRVGVLAENVFNSFAWDTTKLAFMPGTGSFNATSSSTDFDQQAYAAAPQFLRDIVAAQTFKPAVTVGGALQLSRLLTVTGDMKTSFGTDEAIMIGPKSRVGVGAELRLLPFLPIRAGVASVTDGWQAGAGVGLRLLGFELAASTSIRKIGEATQSGLMVGLVGIGH
jgi:hypothetical protein